MRMSAVTTSIITITTMTRMTTTMSAAVDITTMTTMMKTSMSITIIMTMMKTMTCLLYTSKGATYEDVANDYQQEYENLIALAARDGKIRELFKKLTRDCEVTFFTLKRCV